MTPLDVALGAPFAGFRKRITIHCLLENICDFKDDCSFYIYIQYKHMGGNDPRDGTIYNPCPSASIKYTVFRDSVTRIRSRFRIRHIETVTIENPQMEKNGWPSHQALK